MGCKEVVIEPLLGISTEIIGQFMVHNLGNRNGRMLEAVEMAFIERDESPELTKYYRNIRAGYIMDGGDVLSWGLIYELYEGGYTYSHHMDVYTVPHARGNGYGTMVVRELKKLHDGEIYVYKKSTSIYERLGL